MINFLKKLLTSIIKYGTIHCQVNYFTVGDYVLEKNLFFSVLYDYYGKLLNDNQMNIIDLYYNQDYSLSEIAEEISMTRQGVHDALKRAEKILVEYEEKIKLQYKFEKINIIAENIINLTNNITDEKYMQITTDIKNQAIKIIDEG